MSKEKQVPQGRHAPVDREKQLSMQLNDELAIHKLFEDGDRALISADIATLSRIFADDYIQYDESGKPSTKQEVINNLTSGAIRYLSMTSTGRHIRRLKEDVATVQAPKKTKSSKPDAASKSATSTPT